MAADRPLAERGIVEFKMGRSKFPGKPSKIGNRKRVNLSSCALPEENDSSKAAKNIYLGLSVFNETFGDNDMILPGPFRGFSMDEVEEAMAEARLQQKESEVEHQKQGISINHWSNFQSELFSIACNNTLNAKGFEVNKTNLSFDGGGCCKKTVFAENSLDNSDNQPSKIHSNRSIDNRKQKKIFKAPERKIKKSVKFKSPRLKLSKLQRSPVLNKSLQSQAAKKLLEKAKMSNLLENNKNVAAEKKFILPSHSIHSSRIIKPNKRFFEENMSKRKFLRSTSNLFRKPKITTFVEDPGFEKVEKLREEFKVDSGNDDWNKKNMKKEEIVEVKSNESKNFIEVAKNNSFNSSTGKIILREPRLQLDKGSISLLEGPFSTPNSSSLSPNSQLKVNPMQSVTASGSIVCGVCGVVKFYKFVELAKKFGINCCEVCQKFISKILNSIEINRDFKLQCLKNSGLCGINPVVNSEHFNISMSTKHSRCQACWLKSCLKNFKMPTDLKQKLLKLLPMNMQISINLEYHSISNDITNKFKLDNKNITDFKWIHEMSSHESKYFSKDNFTEKQLNWPSFAESTVANEKALRKRTRNSENENKVKVSCQNVKVKTDSDEKNNRQVIMLKGPRVKHVCRSASVVLGQPLATFSSEMSTIKKQQNDLTEDCKNCDSLETVNTNGEPQGIANKLNVESGTDDLKQGNKEKKLLHSKEVSSNKSGKAIQQTAVVKTKKKMNVKVENPVSMDFWESYDPEEISETGFGLIGSEPFTVRALCFLCGSSGHEKLIHCASCCEPYHEFCIDEAQLKLNTSFWKYDWVCPRCTVCHTCGRTSGQQLRCVKCDNSYHTECADRVGGRLLHSPDRPWVCSVCLRCRSCNGVDVSMFVGNLPLCKACFALRQKGNYCPLCQRCYEDDDYDSKMMECGRCKCWVHAKCEGLSEEKYQVLSFLPESVEYVCRMCCVIPPAPWWLAVEAELKSGYLGVLKALSKNRKACTMLKWSPRKQCTCRQIDFVSRALDFEDSKSAKGIPNDSNAVTDAAVDDECKFDFGKEKEAKFQPSAIKERKTSIEVISHPTESLKLTLKIMKGTDAEVREKADSSEVIKDDLKDGCNNKENTVRVKKCPSNEENGEDSLTGNPFDCHEDSQTSLHSLFKGVRSGSELSDKRSLSSPLNPPSDSGIGSTDDELKANCLTDEESCRLDEQKSNSNILVESKPNCDTSVSFTEGKRECFCFLDVDSYNSRSKPFSPNLMSIKKKVTTSEYSSLHQFHQDMERMIGTSHSVELMDLYHQTIKEIFPWFDPKYSRVQNSSQKVNSGTTTVESTPVKNTPVKNAHREESRILNEKLTGKCLDYFYTGYTVEDDRVCLMCKMVGDGPPGSTGRLLYCGQNEWVHCNCALWSGEVFEEIDGSLQNVHSAINRGRSIRCPECNLKGASIGCCARNCQGTYHFGCARKVGCTFMDDKTMYCPSHVKESLGKPVQSEKDFEIRRPVYVELDKRKTKNADSSRIKFAVGSLQVNNLGKFAARLSDREEAIIPDEFRCTRWFWSCREPWRLVRYHFAVRIAQSDDCEGVDAGINLTIDHSMEPEHVEMKMKQLEHFRNHNAFLDVDEKRIAGKLCDISAGEDWNVGSEEEAKEMAAKKSKRDQGTTKKAFDQFDSKEDENCLSDNQNTADLLPPDIEEAIFKDLPHDILDGISMQDIFMDIKNDSYENVSKDGAVEDPSEAECNLMGSDGSSKMKKIDCHSDQNEFWAETTECRQESIEEPTLKSARDCKRNKADDQTSNRPAKKAATLKANHFITSHVSWNCKTDGSSNGKRRKSPKCHVTVNLLEPQERGNMLQELKFADGLVTISTGALGSMKDLKTRLENGDTSVREEGKENKCLSWRASLQPRLLQVDGGIDSSSSGSEAGESPQRLADENSSSKLVVAKRDSSFVDSASCRDTFPADGNFPFTSDFADENYVHSSASVLNGIPQLDGAEDSWSDWESAAPKMRETNERQKKDGVVKTIRFGFPAAEIKISQCDGADDSDCGEGDSVKFSFDDYPPRSAERTADEPVKCSKCRCTYRTAISYRRHLESCRNEYMLSSSEGEMSDEENHETHSGDVSVVIKSETSESRKTDDNLPSAGVGFSGSAAQNGRPDSTGSEKLEVKKEKTVKRTYARKKPAEVTKKASDANEFRQVHQVLVRPQVAAPALIVQDVTQPNIVPATFIDSAPAVAYVTAVESHNPFGKSHLIAAANHGVVSGNYQFPSAPAEAPYLGGFCFSSQNVQQGNGTSFVLQQAHAPSGTLLPPGAAVIVPGEQTVLGPSNGLFDVVQDPRTGTMFLTGYNQPVFYNMETIVSNTVMQTNQFVSNVFATTYSQTSTQIIQAGDSMEQVVSFPSNYVVVASGPPARDRFLSADELVCVQTPQAVVANQNTVNFADPSLFGASLQAVPTFNVEPKMLPAQMGPVRCLRPVGASFVVDKMANPNGVAFSEACSRKTNRPCLRTKVKAPVVARSQPSNHVRTASAIDQNSAKSRNKTTVRKFPGPKSRVEQAKPRCRALVDYINNFKSDVGDGFSTSVAQAQENAGIQQHCDGGESHPNGKANSFGSAVATNPDEKSVPFNVSPRPALVASPKCQSQITMETESATSTADAAATAAATFSPSSATKAEDRTRSDVIVRCSTIGEPSSRNRNVSKMTGNDSECTAGGKRGHYESGATEMDRIASDFGPRETISIVNESFRLSSSDVLTNKTNFLTERETENCLSMPSLDDPLPFGQGENSISAGEETSPKNKNPVVVESPLPLQEKSQSVNGDSNSPPKILPNDVKSPRTVSEDKFKSKKKTTDQNFLTCNGASESREKKTVADGIQKLENFGNFSQPKICDEKGPKLIFDVVSDDGYQSSSASMAELWAKICDSVQEMRATMKIPHLPVPRKGYDILGMQNHGLQHCLEQLKGVEQCVRYRCRYFVREEPGKAGDDEDEVRANESGCARTEMFANRKEYDMFAWLASKHRQLPKLTETAEETLSSIRRANNLPMAMRYRNLKETSKLYVGVYRSKIHGRGLFCLREIEAGEMVIEYAGEVIRSNVTDKREKHYTKKGIGCYMFRIDDHFVVDATMKGNAARFINHSCEPNCYSRVVDILGKKHIVIFALRRINVMEELTYDYKFPLEDEKISCHCQSKKCKKYLN